MLSKLTNANFINRGETHKKMSLNALNNLNLIYLYWSNRFQDEKNNFTFLIMIWIMFYYLYLIVKKQLN